MWNNATYTPVGMTTTLIGQEIGCIVAVTLSATYLSLYVSTCLYISALMLNVGEYVKKFDELVPQLPKSRKNMETRMIDMLRLHWNTIS